jgi:hypothetical protein
LKEFRCIARNSFQTNTQTSTSRFSTLGNKLFRSRQAPRAALLVLGACLCLVPLPLAAEQSAGGALSAALVPDKGRLFLSAVFRLTASRDVLEPIGSGLKSRAVFTVQLVEPRSGLWSFLGDVVLLEKNVTFVAYKEFYENVFVIEDEAGRKTAFAREDDFAVAFASLSRYPLEEFLAARGRAGSFLRVRAKVYPVQLVSPLTLIYLLSSSGVIESDWERVALP